MLADWAEVVRCSHVGVLHCQNYAGWKLLAGACMSLCWYPAGSAAAVVSVVGSYHLLATALAGDSVDMFGCIVSCKVVVVCSLTDHHRLSLESLVYQSGKPGCWFYASHLSVSPLGLPYSGYHATQVPDRVAYWVPDGYPGYSMDTGYYQGTTRVVYLWVHGCPLSWPYTAGTGRNLQIHNRWIFISGTQVVSGSKTLPG